MISDNVETAAISVMFSENFVEAIEMSLSQIQY